MKLLDISTRKHPGIFCMVDDEDYERLSRFKWFPVPRPNGYYAERNGADRKKEFLHRLVLNAPNGLLVDHIDGNTLNNQKSNLRLATHAENLRNRGMTAKTNRSAPYKGVVYCKRRRRFRAQIGVDYRKLNLGNFSTAEAAALAYNEAALRYHGEFANLNTIPGTSNAD